MESWFRERFASRARVRDIGLVPSGSPVAYHLAVAPDPGPAGPKTVTAAVALARRGATLLRAKRALEAMIEQGRAYLLVPTVEDTAALAAELAACGIRADRVDSPPEAAVDVAALRERLGLTQEGFALRYGLDVDAVQNWESGRRRPDTAARSYLRVIAREPEVVEAALRPPVEEPTG